MLCTGLISSNLFVVSKTKNHLSKVGMFTSNLFLFSFQLIKKESIDQIYTS